MPFSFVREAHGRGAISRLGTLVALHLVLAACGHGSDGPPQPPSVVGAWVVTIPEAPFPLHVFAFHGDGTVQQSNPDAGDATSSDSSAMGVWHTERDGIKGRLVEVTADRATRAFLSRGEITFFLKVEGNAFSGTAVAVFYGANGERVRGPVQATLRGQRVVP